MELSDDSAAAVRNGVSHPVDLRIVSFGSGGRGPYISKGEVGLIRIVGEYLIIIVGQRIASSSIERGGLIK